MSSSSASELPETWIARAGDTLLLLQARQDGVWTWEILRQRWFLAAKTVAMGQVSGPLAEARRTVEAEARGRGLLRSGGERNQGT